MSDNIDPLNPPSFDDETPPKPKPKYFTDEQGKEWVIKPSGEKAPVIHLAEEEPKSYSSREPLPRLELRESAFRTYERFIARACRGTCDIEEDEIALSGGKRMRSARTFAVRFRDAVLGYKKHHYPSTSIPEDYPLDCLKPKEYPDGTLVIVNEYHELLKKVKIIPGHKRDLVFVALYMISRPYYHVDQSYKGPTIFSFASATDVEYFASLIARFKLTYALGNSGLISVSLPPPVPPGTLIES